MADGAFSRDTGVPTLAIPTTLPDAKGKPCKKATGVKKVKGKPTVEMPEGKPPTELEKTDLKVGTGDAEAKVGDTIKVNYVGIACSTGKQFDASWDNGDPVDFQLAEGSLIKGWLDGIPGMREGGQRRLVIPADLAYGAEGREGIGPNESLVFVIDLIGAKPTPATTTVPVTDTTAPAEGSSTTGSSTTEPGNGSSTTTGSSTTSVTTIPLTTTTEG
ncbi:MAG: FKBP-type peptidyl-prolyl cis-trans isomerase [Acidimicrobiales bacterium]